jgi:hypothetical protein
MTIQGNSLSTGNIFGVVSSIAKNSGNSGVSAFDSSRQLQPQLVNRDIVTISGGGGKTTVTTSTTQSWVFHGAYDPFDFQDKYNAYDALFFNFATSVRPDINQIPGRDIQLTGIKGGSKEFNIEVGTNVISTEFLKKHETVAGLDKNMTIDEFLAHVQKNGLDKNINWTNVAETLLFDSNNVNSKTFTEYSDYTAAVFVALENRIMNDFTGEEQKAELAKLNEVFTAKTQEFKDVFYNNALSWLKEYEGENYVKGVSESKFKASIEAVFTDKINNFRNIAASNPDFAGIKGTDNQWLERDVRFMANKLMEAAATSESTSAASGLISEKDLLDMTRLQEAFDSTPIFNTIMGGGSTDEETMGLVIGSRILKAVWLADEKNMSEKAREALQKMRDKFMVEQIEKFNEQNEITRHLTEADNFSRKQQAPLVKEAVINIINNLLDEYSKSKNAPDALQKTAAFAFKIHMEKAQSADFKNLMRYGSESWKGEITKTGDGGFFWQNFYEPKEPISHPYSAMHSRPSMSNILNDWDSFVNSWQ